MAAIAMAMLAATAAAAAPGPDLMALPVAATEKVAAERYQQAAALASRGADPVDIALAVAGPFEGVVQQLLQVNEGAEGATASRVIVLRDGLLDDSVRGDRWEITLQRTPAGSWRVVEVTRAWRCRRGPVTSSFSATACP